MNRNPTTALLEESVLEVSQLQKEISARVQRIHEVASSVYRRARRDASADSAMVYATYANAMLRYASTVEQISNRTKRSARILERLPANKDESEAPSSKVAATAPQTSPMESLIDLYAGTTADLIDG